MPTDFSLSLKELRLALGLNQDLEAGLLQIFPIGQGYLPRSLHFKAADLSFSVSSISQGLFGF